MSSQQIQTLLAAPNIQESQQKAIILLNSQFRSIEDLDALEPAISQAQQHDDELRSKLAISQANIDALVSETHSLALQNLQTAQELSIQRHSLADELSYLTQELVSSMSDEEKQSTLLEDIETLHRNLKELQSVKGYVQVIEHSLKLSESAVEQIRSSDEPTISSGSIAEYQSLQEFVSKVSQSCSQVEDADGQQNLQLVTFLERIRDKTWGDIKGALSASLLEASEKLKWPMPVDYSLLSLEDRRAFESAFVNLLKLQSIGEKIKPSDVGTRSEKDGLYPIQSLVHAISLRFKYHFEGTRQTNRLDKPEWYFTHILNVVHEHRSFMESIVQRLLSSFPDYSRINAWREFTLLLLPLLSRKLRRTVPALLGHPSLLAHTIYQALSFDAALLEEGFSFADTSASSSQIDADGKWEGVSEIILGKKEWFEAWLEGEKTFAEDQYNEIITAADAWLMTDGDEGKEDAHQDQELKTTHSARKFRALIEQVTDRYSPLPHFTHRARFLTAIQLPLLKYYHERISSSLDAFETLSSAFVRAVPGALGVTLGSREETGAKIDTRRLTSGVEGVQRLCKALTSAKYIEFALETWGEDLFFLELWTEINRRPSLRALAEEHPLLPHPSAAEGDVPQETIFEELAVHYQKLVSRAQDMIVQQIYKEIEGDLRAHLLAAASPRPNTYQTDELALPQTLLAPIALLSSHLTFLRSTLPPTTTTSLYRQIASHLSEHIVQRQILYRGHINAREGKIIRAECELWVETCQAALVGIGGGRTRIETPWLTLLQAGRLVGIEGKVWERVVTSTFGSTSEEAWDEMMREVVGVTEMGREEVKRVLMTREDCQQQ